MTEDRVKLDEPNDDEDKNAQGEVRQSQSSITLQKAGTFELTNVSPWIIATVDRLSKAEPGDILEIAASQIQLLGSYYDEVLGQTQRSFKWALVFGGVGFVFFLIALGFLLLTQLHGVANISLISGGIIEAIAAINFYLYGRTSAQLAEFHTRLDQTQRFLLANSLCESLEGDFKQKARLELIRTIAGIGINEIESPQPHQE